MPRPDQDPDEHDVPTGTAVPTGDAVRNGNPGKPQSDYLDVEADLTPEPGPSEQRGDAVSPGPADQD